MSRFPAIHGRHTLTQTIGPYPMTGVCWWHGALRTSGSKRVLVGR
jgi:hypothetical protein